MELRTTARDAQMGVFARIEGVAAKRTVPYVAAGPAVSRIRAVVVNRVLSAREVYVHTFQPPHAFKKARGVRRTVGSPWGQ